MGPRQINASVSAANDDVCNYKFNLHFVEYYISTFLDEAVDSNRTALLN